VERAAADIPGLLENRKQGLAMLPLGGDVYDHADSGATNWHTSATRNAQTKRFPGTNGEIEQGAEEGTRTNTSQ
jgi:hypothetical protein